MMMMSDNDGWEYLGDGVYAKFDGYGIQLHANSHDNPTDRIYLEPDVLTGIINYLEEQKQEKINNADG